MADDRALGTQIAHRNLLRADESCGVVDPPQGDVDVWSEKQGAVLAEPGRYEAGVKRRQLGHRPIRRMRDEYPRDVLVSAAFDGGDDRRDQRGGEVVGQPIRCARDRERTRVADVVDEMAVDRVVVPAVGQRRCGVGRPSQRCREHLSRLAGRAVWADCGQHAIRLKMKPENDAHVNLRRRPLSLRRWARWALPPFRMNLLAGQTMKAGCGFAYSAGPKVWTATRSDR